MTDYFIGAALGLALYAVLLVLMWQIFWRKP